MYVFSVNCYCSLFPNINAHSVPLRLFSSLQKLYFMAVGKILYASSLQLH